MKRKAYCLNIEWKWDYFFLFKDVNQIKCKGWETTEDKKNGMDVFWKRRYAKMIEFQVQYRSVEYIKLLNQVKTTNKTMQVKIFGLKKVGTAPFLWFKLQLASSRKSKMKRDLFTTSVILAPPHQSNFDFLHSYSSQFVTKEL